MTVTDEAITRIKGMILSGELRPGDRLPPEKEFSERLGLSRSSLREAVKALELIRVLDARRGDGTYVTSLKPQLLLEAVSFAVDLHQDDSILELFEVRRILESTATAMAAARITQHEAQALRELMGTVDELTEVEELVAHDLDFHRMLAKVAGNSYLGSLLDGMAGRTVRARVWRGLTELPGPNAVARTLAEHGAILDAVVNHDVELARTLSAAHVASVEDWLRRAS
jgi:GntR family transcriptional repressor for pyruvate dehydrogenase complex